MNEIPPVDAGPYSEPAFTSVDPSEVDSAKSMAKFSLWSPFLGILAYMLVALLALPVIKLEPVANLLVALSAPWVLWVAGLTVGFIAIHKTAVVGKEGVFVRAVIGISLDGILICLTVLGTFGLIGKYHQNVKLLGSQRLSESDPTQTRAAIIASVETDFQTQSSDLQRAYDIALAATTNPPVLNMALVKNKNDLEARKEKIRKFMKSNAEVRDWWTNSTETYGRLLNDRNATPQMRDELLLEVDKKLQPIVLAIVDLRNCDESSAKAMLAVISFLEDHWGEWFYQEATHKIIFKKANLLDPYNRLMSEVKKQSAEYKVLQTRAKEIHEQLRPTNL